MSWELAVIGTALTDPGSMAEAEDLLPSDFTGTNQSVWAEILALHNRRALEVATLSAALQTSGNFREGELASLLHDALAARGASMREFVDQVLSASTRRSLRRSAALIAAEADGNDKTADELLDYAETQIMGLRRNRVSGFSLGDIIAVFMPRLQGMLDGTFKPAWTPFTQAVRDIIKYAEDTDLIVVAARPGEGKSSWLRFEADKSIHLPEPEGVLIFNYDNDNMDYARWFIAMETGIDSDKLKEPRLMSEEELSRVRAAAEDLARRPLYIESAYGDIHWIKRTTRKYVSERKIKRMCLDYAQKVNNGMDGDNANIEATTQGLREINMQLHIPILAASQLNREIEKRGVNDQTPMLSDLRGSGALEQDGTIVMYPRAMWRNPSDAEQRQFPENVDRSTGRLYPRMKAIPIQFYVQKNRNGSSGVSTPVKWVKSTNRYETLVIP
jgi:replicative DNA helicase